MTWFLADDDSLWWCGRTGATTEYRHVPRTPRLDGALDEMLDRLDHLKAEAEAEGRGLEWPRLVRMSSFGSAYWTSNRAPDCRS